MGENRREGLDPSCENKAWVTWVNKSQNSNVRAEEMTRSKVFAVQL